MPAQQIARPHTEKVAGGVLLPIPEGQRNGAPQLVLFSNPSELSDSLWHPVHQVLVVEDDYLLDLVRDPVDGAIVGGSLLGPLVDAPALLLVGLLQRIKEADVGQHAAEARTGVVGEDIRRLVGSQPRLYDLADLIEFYCLELQDVFRVLLLEPINQYLRYRPLLGGRLFGPGKELDNVPITTQAPTAARGTYKRCAGESQAAEPEETFTTYRPWHLSFTRSPCPRGAFL